MTITNTQVKHIGSGNKASMPIITDDKALSYRLAALIATMVINERSASLSTDGELEGAN